MKLKEKIISINKSSRKGKKYMATIQDKQTKEKRKIHFGASNYEQFYDSTPLGLYSHKNHLDKDRRKNYFKRHSGLSTKQKSIKKELKLSDGYYTPKILSHKYLW